MKPVVIVGGGPAGSRPRSTCARSSPRSPSSCSSAQATRATRCARGAIAGRVLPLLARLGVDLEHDVHSVRIDRMVVEMNGATIAVKERECGARRPAHRARPRAREAAMEHDIDVRTGQQVTGLDLAGEGVHVTLRDGALDARIVVGADGIMGTTRRALALRTRLRAQAVEVDTERTRDDEPTDTARFVFDRSLRGYRWTSPRRSTARSR